MGEAATSAACATLETVGSAEESTTSDTASPRPPLVGREATIETILGVAERARTQAGLVLITGEAGMGKTVLLAEVRQRLQGFRVLDVRGDSFESDLSYAAVESLTRRLRALVSTPLPAPRPGDDALTVGRLLLDAIDGLHAPVCLLVDDAQWIDEASMRVFRFVARRLLERPFLALAAARPEAQSVLALHESLAGDMPNRATLELSALTVADTQQLAHHVLQHAVSRRTATRLTEATQGSPLLVSMLLRQLGESLTGAPHPAGWHMPRVLPLAAAVSHALEGATDATRTGAELVAVLRTPVPFAQVGDIADLLGAAVDLRGAVSRGLVHWQEHDGVVWLEPAHAMLADALAARMPARRRMEIHRAAAQVLTGHRALRHRVEAADHSDSRLVDELLAASRAAADLDQPETAMSYARSAVHLASTPTERERCLLEAGLLAMRTRRHELVFDLHAEIEALPVSLVRDTLLVELRVLTGDVPGAFALATDALATDEDTPDARLLRSRVAGAVPKLQMATRDFAPVIEQVASARRLLPLAPTDPGEVADPALRWMVEPVEEELRLLGWLVTAAGHARRDEVLEAAIAQMTALERHAPDSAGLADALITRARILILIGRLVDARADLTKANRLIRRFPACWTAGHGRTIYAHLLFLLGEWDESVTLADSAVALALDETDLSGWPAALTSSALVRAGRGEAQAVRERLDSAARARPGITGSYDVDLAWIARAELARALGDREGQLAAADAGAAIAAPSSTMGWLSYRIDALVALGRGAEAREALAGCTDPTRRWQPHYGSLAWLQGRVAEAEGDRARALALYARAYESEETVTLPLPLAVALRDAGRLLAAEHRAPEAARLLERAQAIFGRLGAGTYLAACTAELSGLAGRHPRVDPVADALPDPFAALTTRERQVAHALVAGMTNKEIAELLYVSVTTVNFHVRNILSKLELRSRRDLRGLVIASRGRHPLGGRHTPRSPVKS